MRKSGWELATRWFDEVWNQGRRETIAEMLAPDSTLHEGGTASFGPGGFYPLYDRLRASFSEIHVNVDDVIEDGDKMCVRWSFSGKHTGDGLGVAATGKTVRVTGMTLIRFQDGLFLEGWQNWDMLSMMEQIQGARRAPTFVGA
jgi:steroid delta-isomerase-like uncharacterized protein